MEHIKRMEKELLELDDKIEKLDDFITSELKNSKFTDEEQRMFMAVQLAHMISYRNILEVRIKNDKEKMGGKI